jgi:putative inorganic carbon (hco3(-)) transporter
LLGLLSIVGGNRLRPSRFLAMSLIGGASVAALEAIFDLTTGSGVQVEGVTRIAGPYPHPNALALYTTRVVCLALAWAAFDPRVRGWLAGAALVTGVATVASFSRGALVALVLSASLLLPAVERRLRLATILGTLTAASVLVIAERDRMLDLFSGGSGSLRIDIWRSAIHMIRDRPFMGYGPDQFLYAYVPRYIEPSAWNERFTAHAHNLILDFWIRLGIIGGAFALVAVVSCVVRAHDVVVARRTETDVLATAGAVALLAALLHGFVDNAYFSHDLAMSGWFLAWLAFAPAITRRPEGKSSSARPCRWRSWIHRVTSVRQSARRRPCGGRR